MVKTTNQQINYLWQISAGQRFRILLSCITGITHVSFSLGFIYASKIVIDIASGAQKGDLWVAGGYTTALLLLQIVCGATDTWLSTRITIESGNALRHRLFNRLLQSRWNELERFHTGDIINRIEQDTNAIVNLLTSSIPTVLVASIQLLAAFLFFCSLDTSLPWLLVALVPAFLVASRFYTRKMKRYTTEIRQSDSSIQSIIQESIQHRMVIKTLEQGERHVEKLDTLQERLCSQVYGRTRFSIFSRLLTSLAFSGGYLIAFLWGAVRMSTGSITFGSMTAFLQLVGKIQQPALGLSRLLPSFINALTAIERLQELESLPSESQEKRILFSATPDLILKNITFAYAQDEKPILKHFSAEFPAGSSTAIIGETGAGKTTLIRLLLALAQPQEGEIALKMGKECISVSTNTRCNFVYVPQGGSLFSGTIRDNLLMGNPQATEVEMEQALQTAVAQFVYQLPKGIDTTISELGGGLSEGQAQRIAIARALLRPGTILLLDESTSALDQKTEKQLLANLERDCIGKTFIFITHHPALADACQRKYQL